MNLKEIVENGPGLIADITALEKDLSGNPDIQARVTDIKTRVAAILGVTL